MKRSQHCERLAGRLALRMSWRSVMFTFFGLVVGLYLLFTITNDRYIHHTAWYERPAPCVTPDYVKDEIVKLTFDVSDLLTKLQVSHTVCFGTLWGILRYGRILPWDNNADFCVLKNEMEKVPWSTLHEAFQASNMEIMHDSRHGEYIITRGPAQAFLTVFYVTNFGEVFKDGYENRFLWFFQDSPVSFPQRLIQPPFRQVTFHGRPLPVPNDDLEILKYLYKDDWWIEKPPPGCPRVVK